MALVFKVNDTRIYPIVNTTITERVGTFSDGSLPLEISNIRECFIPMSQLTIEDTETNSKWFYVIVADDVERVSKSNELCYRHLKRRRRQRGSKGRFYYRPSQQCVE